jgi:hypothetical protein
LYRVSGTSPAGTQPGALAAHLVLDSWDEGSVTWSGQPELRAVAAAIAVPGAPEGYIDWDVTLAVREAAAAGAAGISFALLADAEAAGHPGHVFSSREAPADRPPLLGLALSGVGPRLVAQPRALGFGEVTVGTASLAQLVALRNEGDQPLTVEALSSGSDELLVSVAAGAALPSSIPAGGELILQAVFAPSAEGDWSAAISVETEAAESPLLVAVSGTGVSGGVTGFLRGDCNGDGRVDISDAVGTLQLLFQGGGSTTCHDACDSNDDGAIDISDAINTLNVLFLGKGSLPAPGMADCGADPTADELGCEAYGGCS